MNRDRLARKYIGKKEDEIPDTPILSVSNAMKDTWEWHSHSSERRDLIDPIGRDHNWELNRYNQNRYREVAKFTGISAFGFEY